MRVWNVPSDLERGCSENGSSCENFGEHTVGLGLQSSEKSCTLDIAARVSYITLAMFDSRESNYTRIDVTRSISWAAPRPDKPFRVFTYITSADAASRLEELR
jgi:hypothetical protein